MSDIRGDKWDLNLIPDLTGKVALVTGAASSSGIGFHIAHQLALKGATIYIGARSIAKTEAAIKDMFTLTPSLSKNRLKGFVADLADLKQVKHACEKFKAEESRLDILVHNAGTVSSELDQNGLLLTIVVNHITPFLMTKEFLALLRSSPDARVVTLSSIAHKMPPFPLEPLRFDTKESLNIIIPEGRSQYEAIMVPYAHSKLANILFASQLQKKLDAEEEANCPISMSVHPGTVNTQSLKDFCKLINSTHYLDIAMTPLEGAITPLFAATAPEVRKDKMKFGGSYLMPFNVVSPDDMSEHAKKTEFAENLWNTSEQVVVDIFRN